MARINLLPWREWDRERRKKEFFAIAGIMAGAGAVVLLVGFLVLKGAISSQQERNAYLNEKIAELDKQVQEIEQLQKQKAEMQEKIDVVQNLQANRSVVVRLIQGLVDSLPDGVYFKSVSLAGEVINIEGTAEANARISSLMRSLSEAELFADPNLLAVKANPLFGESASDFKLTVKLVLPGNKDGQKDKN